MDDGPIVPAPWSLRYDGLIMVLAARSRAAAAPGLAGWLSAVSFVDYSESPVGPYRELLHASRVLRLPGFVGPTVRDIWVTTEASVRSGNANWGLTKSVISIDRLEAGGTHRWVAREGNGSEGDALAGDGEVLADITHRPWGPLLPVAKPKWLGTLLQQRDGKVFQTPVSAQALMRFTRIDEATMSAEHVVDLERHRIVAAVAISHGRMGFHVPKITPVA